MLEGTATYLWIHYDYSKDSRKSISIKPTLGFVAHN